MPAIRAIPGPCAASTWRSSPPTPGAGGRPFDGEEGERAAKLYERVFLGYGDDSIAQVGGAHIACEWVSNILTKVLQRGRLAAYLEQSTRYIPYDQPLPATPAAATATTATQSSGPEFADGDGRAVRDLLALAATGRGLGSGALAPRRRRARGRLAALDPRQGARPAARPAPGGDPEPRRHLRLRAGLRAADPAADGLAAAGGARVRRDDPARAAAGDAELRLPGRAARPRRRVDRLPAAPPRGNRALGVAARPRPPRRRRGRALGRAGPRRRHRGGSARLLPVRVRAAPRRPRSSPGSTCSTAPSGPSCSARWSASGPTAATVPAAASRRCATASRSSPTTAPSATCSATGC